MSQAKGDDYRLYSPVLAGVDAYANLFSSAQGDNFCLYNPSLAVVGACANLFRSEPGSMAVRLASIVMLLLGQLPLHHKNGVTLLP